MTRRNTSDGAGPLGRLGSFALCEAIAHGSFSTVWSGYHLEQGFPVAIKVMRPAARGGTAARTAMFAREVRSLGALDHPFIVRIFDHGTLPNAFLKHRDLALLPGAPHLVLERASGGSLETMDQAPTWPFIRRVALSLLDALAHAHARGIYHLDVKPANVLICDADDMRPGVKLTDWGLAQSPQERTDNSMIDGLTGTPQFMAPEQFAGRWREYGPWTDLYALGGVIWALATGDAPFGGGFEDVFRSQTTQIPAAFVPRWAMPDRLEEWLLTALHKDPAHRFQTAAEASCALRSLDEAATPVPWAPAIDHLYAQEPLLDDDTWLGPESADLEDSSLFVFDDSSSAADNSGDFDRTIQFAEEGATSEFNVGPLAAAQSVGSNASGAVRQWPRPRLPPQWGPPSARQRAPTEPALFDLRTPQMQGRRQERQALWELLRQAVAGQLPAVALVQGPAGSGKSRLLSELGDYADEAGGVTVVRAGGRPLRESMRAFLRTQGLTDRHAIQFGRERLEGLGMNPRHAGALAVRLVSELSADDEFLALVMEMFSVIGRTRPVLVLLDDADRHIDALSLTARMVALAPAHVCVVASARRAEIPSGLGRALKALEQRVQLRIRLGRLSRAQQEALIADLLWLPKGLIRRTASWTQGNPGLAVDTVEHWVRHEQLRRGRGGYRVTPEGLTLLDAAGNRRFKTVKRSQEFLPTQPVSVDGGEDPESIAPAELPSAESAAVPLRADTP